MKCGRAAVVSAAAFGGLVWMVERFGRRSGASRQEAKGLLPGDELVESPLWASTRAISIDAPPEAVWPWVVQMGFPPHRAGWYTPYWLDRLMWGDRPRSAEKVVPELQDLRAGDTVPDSADWSVYYDVEAAEAPRHLVLHSRRHVFPPLRSSNFSWSFDLRPEGPDDTRLLVRARVRYSPLWAAPLIDAAIGLGDWVNVSVMLRGIRRRATSG